MRLIRYQLMLLALLVAGVAPVVQADSVESRIEVPSRSDSERARGAIRGLFQLLRELYPPDHPMTASQRRALSGEANDFVQRYGYLTDATGNIVLRLQFDEKAIHARVREMIGEPTSGAGAGVEPALLWLVVSQGQDELLLTQGSQGLLPDTLDQIAAALSQPLVFPRDDVLTTGEITGADVRAVNAERLQPASAQYAASQTVVLSMKADGDEWRGDWTLLATGERWTSTGPLSDMLRIGLTAYQGRAAALEQTQQVAGSYGAGRGEVTVSVDGVSRSADYAWLSVTLRRRFPSGNVRAVSIGGGKAVFVIGADGDVAGVAQSMGGVQQLQLVLPSQPTGGITLARDTDLHYVLAR